MNDQEVISVNLDMLNKKVRVTTPCRFVYDGILTIANPDTITLDQCDKFVECNGELEKINSYKQIILKQEPKKLIIELIKDEVVDENTCCDHSNINGTCIYDVEGIPIDTPIPPEPNVEDGAAALFEQREDHSNQQEPVAMDTSADENGIIVSAPENFLMVCFPRNEYQSVLIPGFGVIPPTDPSLANDFYLPVFYKMPCMFDFTYAPKSMCQVQNDPHPKEEDT